jgi:endoglucanase
MKRIAWMMACFLFLSACGAVTPEPQTSPSEEPGVVEIPWDGKPSPVPPEPSPIPDPVFTADIPVPDVTQRAVMDTEPLSFAAALGPGWNLGNTLDATGGSGLNTEISWGNPKTTQAMIDAVKEAGFKTLRVPVTWHKHVDGDFTVDPEWMDRVQEVVDYAYGIGLFVILNIHHDDDKKYVYPDSEHFENSAKFVGRIWEQAALRFRDYSERLIFEGLNEPRLKGHPRFEWWQDWNDEACIDALDALCRLQQVFVDTVRASGGNNAGRYLMICGLGANADSVVNGPFRLPEDTVPDRLIISVHAYTPWQFALQLPGRTDFDMTEERSTRDIDSFMDGLYEKYIANGIPVVLGECGALDKSGNLTDRTEWAAYYFASAAARGMPAIWWDNGAFSGNGEIFGIFDRRSLTWVFPGIVEALMRYGTVSN